MKILFVAPLYDYGKKENGLSLEELHLAKSMEDYGIEITRFDFLALSVLYGDQIMNEMLRTAFLSEDFDIVMYVPYIGTEVTFDTWDYTKAVKVLWAFNDVWRFQQLGAEICWYFDWILSDYEDAPARYSDISFDNALYVPRACRTQWFVDAASADKPIDVAFIGQFYGYRPELMAGVQNGLPAAVVRYIAPVRVRWEEYIRVFCQSKIIISPSLSSQGNHHQTKTRDFEAASAGAWVLSDNPSINKHLTWFELFDGTASDAIEKITAMLAGSIPPKLSEQSKCHVIVNHDYRIRLKTIFERITLA